MVLTEKAEQSAIGKKDPLAALLEGSDQVDLLSQTDSFAHRHIGPSAQETSKMLECLGYSTLDALIDDAIPAQIRLTRPMQIPAGRSEYETLKALKEIAAQNQMFRSYIGMGYY